MRKPFTIFILIIAFAFVGCQSAMKGLMGIKDVKPLYTSDLPDLSIEFDISPDMFYLIDTTSFLQFLSSLPDTSQLKHDFYQPLQVMAFDSTGRKYTHIVNCSIGGFKNLDWNKYGAFDSFPLSCGKFYNSDTTVNLRRTFSFFYQQKGVGITNPDFSTADEIIVVFWVKFMKRQSQRLIDLINNYEEKFINKDIRVYYIALDNLYLKNTKK